MKIEKQQRNLRYRKDTREIKFLYYSREDSENKKVEKRDLLTLEPVKDRDRCSRKLTGD